jgi:hypothetical protein
MAEPWSVVRPIRPFPTSSPRPVVHRIDLDSSRLLVLAAADALDRHGFKGAAGAIAAAKVATPNTVQRCLDAAIQVRAWLVRAGRGGCSSWHILHHRLRSVHFA